ncbi:hypothetical protein X975_25489, partial [Stegodyphus mimosarum]
MEKASLICHFHQFPDCFSTETKFSGLFLILIPIHFRSQIELDDSLQNCLKETVHFILIPEDTNLASSQT